MMWAPVLLTVLGTAAAHPIAKRTTAAEWTSLGCIADSEERVLRFKVPLTTDNSPDVCVDACASRGFTYAGLQCE